MKLTIRTLIGIAGLASVLLIGNAVSAAEFLQPIQYANEPLSELSLFAGVASSKQPQDFGVNGNFGGRTSINWSRAIHPEWGVGFQLGTALTATGNSQQAYENLGENTGRVQSFTTVGVFQRLQSGWTWGVANDLLFQESFDEFFLTQTRFNTAFGWDRVNELGLNVYLSGARDTGSFNATPVTLDPISQGHIYWRSVWSSDTQTTFWFGLAEGHGESNAISGPARPQDEAFVFGADILAPLTDWLAIYGETNLIMPADTGAIDGFIGLQYYPNGKTSTARKRRFSPVFPVAANSSFAVDLSQ